MHNVNIKKAPMKINDTPKNNNAITYAHKAPKKAFKKVLMQVISNNKVHMKNNIIAYSPQECKKPHKKLLEKVLMQLKSNNEVNMHKNAYNIHHKRVFNKVLVEIKSNNKVSI